MLPSDKNRNSNLNTKMRRQRDKVEPRLPGAAIRLSHKEIDSVFQSKEVDKEGHIILERHINLLRRTCSTSGNGVELSALLNRLRDEAATLHSKLSRRSESIKEHLSSIAKLEAETITIRNQRNKVLQLHDHVHSFSFKFPSLIPSEILSEIFIACLPQHPSPRISEAPLLLCRVCTSWRKIALSTPQLWSSITLSHLYDVENLPKVANNWFSRSGVLPLSLRFDIVNRHESIWHTSYSPPQHPIYRQLSNLEIVTVYAQDVQSILRKFRHSSGFPKIERLSVRTRCPVYGDILGPKIFPNLRRLILSYNEVPFNPSDFMTFTHLTHLSITGLWLSAQSWSVMIRRCLHLQHGVFVIATAAMNTPHVETRTLTTLDHLQTLKIVLHTFGYERMMNNLHFPSLRSLNIGCAHRSGPCSPRFLSPIVLDRLQSLVFYKINITSKSLMGLLRQMNSLECLVIDLSLPTSKLIEGITFNPQSAILPFLTKLTLFHVHKDCGRFDANNFVNMVRSRWDIIGEGGSVHRQRIAIVSVRIEHFDVQVDCTQRLLSRQIQEGLRLQIGLSKQGLRVSTDVVW